MNSIIKSIYSIGIGNESNFLERRRVGLLNICLLVMALITLTYIIMNLILGSFSHVVWLSSGYFFLALPVYFFNYRRYHNLSRTYFIFGVLIIISLIGYNSISNFENRHNEVLFIGFSAVIVILFDNPQKIIIFIVTVISCLTIYLTRWEKMGVEFGPDILLSITNVLVSFACVYLSTSLFKDDLLKSINKVQEYSAKLEQTQMEITLKNKDLLNNKQLLRSLIDNIPIFLVLIDLNGNYIIANQKFKDAFVSDIDQIEGNKGKKFLSKHMNEIQDSMLERCLRGEETEFDRLLVLTNQEQMHVYGKIIPIYDDDNNVKSFIQYGTDVTKLKQIEKELKELNETKNKLLSIISHDLKGPINSLKGLIYLSDSLSVVEMKKLMIEVEKQVDSVSFTMDNLLAWVGTQFEGFEAVPQHFDISETICQCIELYSDKIREKNIAIEIERCDDSTIYADINNISLVCRNLLSNAIKFTQNYGKISLSYQRRNEYMIVSIIDNGIGISAEDLVIIMNSTMQNISRIGTEGEKGTGLGLAFCKDVLKMNGAQMNIESEVNLGTKVEIVIPIS